MSEIDVDARGEGPRLGRLTQQDPRSVWPHEERDFTPWLLANADVLSEALGLDLELEVAEHPVGPFELDLLGRDLSHDAVLVVENQLGHTDHSHLGQVLTYAAGTDAATVVWIATRFTEEHRQALDWLNDRTDEDTRFFGIVLELVRIADSLPAPHLRVVASPNDWQKRAKRTKRATEGGPKAELYSSFWAKLVQRLAEQRPSWTRRRSIDRVTANWLDMPSPLREARLSMSFARGGKLRHEIYLDTGDVTGTRALFERLLAEKAAIEADVGRELAWEELPDRRACRIAIYRDGEIEDVASHEEYIDWLIETGDDIRRAFAGRS